MTASNPGIANADLVFRGRCLLPGGLQQAAVVIRGGIIVHIDVAEGVSFAPDMSGTRDPAQIVDLAHDEVLLPGLVDTHVHVNEPGRTEWEGFASATRAAAAGGVTTIIDMPLNSIPPTVDGPALDLKRAATEGQRFVDVGFWGGAVPASLGHLAEVYDEGVFGFKSFLLHSGVDEFPPLDAGQLEEAMAEIADLDGLLIVHAEDAATIEAAPVCSGPSYANFVRSRPPEAEDRAIGQVIELAGRLGTRVHILHLSNAASLGRLAAARDARVQVTVETCPHYLTLSAEQVEDGATQFKCCPPIRDAANQDLLWQGLGDGVIDIVVSDHSPATPDLKHLESGDFGEAWGGVSSLQLGLSLIWTEAVARGHGLGDVVRWMARGPATVAAVPGKGSLQVGGDADVVVFAPDESFVVDPNQLHHKNTLTPYAGRPLYGLVRQTWLRGQQVADHGTVFDAPTGRLLTRGGSRRV
ncbi:MAG: allantoinase AllB [Nocardioidaceae bacterium]